MPRIECLFVKAERRDTAGRSTYLYINYAKNTFLYAVVWMMTLPKPPSNDRCLEWDNSTYSYLQNFQFFENFGNHCHFTSEKINDMQADLVHE